METCLSVLLMSAACKCEVGNGGVGAVGCRLAAAGARWRMAVHNICHSQEISAPFIIRAVDLMQVATTSSPASEMFTVLLGRMRLMEQHHVTTRPLKT